MNKQLQFSSLEEDLAFEFYKSILKFNSTIKYYESCEIDKSLLKELNFEIVNDFYNKNILISYVLKKHTNINKVEIVLMTLGISVNFLDKSSLEKKRYLVVWK